MLEARWSWAADALKMAREEGSGCGLGGRALTVSVPAAPFFSRLRVVNSPGEEAWSCGIELSFAAGLSALAQGGM